MKTFKNKLLLFYALLWALVFLGPYLRGIDNADPNGWIKMIGDWINLFLLFLVFVVNLWVLVPKLLFKNRRNQYAIVVGVLIVAISLIDFVIHQGNAPHNRPPIHFLLGAIFNNLLLALLIIGSSTAMELFAKWTSEQEIRKELETNQLKTNLELLKNQVSPHFFMNTLNNIHSLIEMDAE